MAFLKVKILSNIFQHVRDLNERIYKNMHKINKLPPIQNILQSRFYDTSVKIFIVPTLRKPTALFEPLITIKR